MIRCRNSIYITTTGIAISPIFVKIKCLLYTVIAFCTTLRMRSADTGRIMTAFSREIYAKNPEASLVDVKHYDTVKDGSGKRIPLFYMQLDTEKTSKENFGPTATDSQLAGYAAKRIGFYNFTATSYEYKPSDAEKEEKLISDLDFYLKYKFKDYNDLISLRMASILPIINLYLFRF